MLLVTVLSTGGSIYHPALALGWIITYVYLHRFIKSLRESEGEGYITFRHAYFCGLTLSFFAFLLYGLVLYLLGTLVFPEILTDARSELLRNAEAMERQDPKGNAGMVAAGGLAAALSTADGLLLTIANALSHDLYYKMIDPNAPTARRVMISKVLLLVVALAAAYVASLKIADILFLVSAAFSLAAASFFPALVLGVFWKRANKWGASLGIASGLGITFYYMVTTQPWLRGIFGVTSPIELWWGILPISAGVFGVPLGFAVIIIVSLLTKAPSAETQELVEHVRYPNLRMS